MVPMLWQMRNTYERWSFFYQNFEISSQLALLFTFLKLLTFSGATFSSRFLCYGILNFLLFIFFLVSYTMCYWGFFVVFQSFDIHIFWVLFFLNPFIDTIYLGSVYINWYQFEIKICSYKVQVFQILIF